MDCADRDVSDAFPEVIRHTEQPILRTAPCPLFRLSKFVRDSGFKVVLTGEGADEVLGGYDIFKEQKVRRFCARAPNSKSRPLLLRYLYPYLPSIQRQPDAYLSNFFRVRPGDIESPFFSHLPRWELTSRTKIFFSRRVKAELNRYVALQELREGLPHRYPEWHSFCQSQFLETAYLLPGYILSSQGDRMAMAHSVEARYPFLDHRVVEFSSRLDPRVKMRVLNEKWILKKAARNLVPESIRHRTKQPYRAPGGRSFFATKPLNYVRYLLSPECIRRSDLFDPLAVSKLVEKFESTRMVSTLDDMAIVGILSSQLWMLQFVENSQVAELHAAY